MIRTGMRAHPRLRDAGYVLLVTALAVAIWCGVSELAALLFGPDYSAASHAFRAVATMLVVVATVFVLTRVGAAVGVPPSGLRPDRHALPAAGLGALGYVVPFALAAAILLSMSVATVALNGTPLDALAQVAAVLVLVLLYEAVPEELLFRGVIFATLRRHLPSWATVLIQAALFCLFGFLIGAAATPDRLLLLALFSLALGVVRAATGSVFAAIGFHAAFQTVTQPVLGAQWTAITLDDPERWFADVAYGLAPLVLGPVLVVLVVRRRRRTASIG